MKKLITSVAATLIAFSLSGCALLYPNWGTDQNPSTSQSATPSESASEQPSATPTAINKSKATVRIDDLYADASAGVISVIAEVTNISQNGGTCTLVLQAGTTTKRLPVKAESNVNTTQCFPMELPLAGLPKGTALVSVEYESSDYYGASQAQSVVIP